MYLITNVTPKIPAPIINDRKRNFNTRKKEYNASLNLMINLDVYHRQHFILRLIAQTLSYSVTR